MVQLMPLLSQNPIVSCLIYTQIGFTFLEPAYQVVLENRPLNGHAVLPAFALCLSVSSTSQSSIETAGWIELVLAWMLPSTYHTLLCKKFGYFKKGDPFPLELCPGLWT